MRDRLVLIPSLATLSLVLAATSAAAQFTYPPGGYRGVERDGVMTAEPDFDERRQAPRRQGTRQPYDPLVESQPLPPVTEREAAPYPYEVRPGRQAMPPLETLPPPPDRSYGARPPAYGAMPPYNEPAASAGAYNGNAYPDGAYSARPDDTRPRPPGAIEGSPYTGGVPTNLAPGSRPGGPTTLASLPPEDQPEIGAPQELPSQFRRQVVNYQTKEPAGTIIIDTPTTFLYYVNGDGTAVRYGIGVGRDGFTWAGTERVSRMAAWPDWHPPAEMIERQPYLPRFMAGGASNPLGARALYLGKTIYRVHGTNQPSTIGKYVSSGCIRMLNEDVEDLYTRVKVGTKVVVRGDGKQPSAPNTSARR